MKRRMLLSVFGVACAALISLAAPHGVFQARALASSPESQEQTASTAGRTPVLVELFTSEGCSDCPPADTLLSQLEARQPITTADVIILELHVTYWDGDWRDRFSSSQYTARQNTYAFGHTGDQMYTPQMVVDGGERFVGSNGKLALHAIDQAAHVAKAPIHLEWAAAAGSAERALHVKVDSLPEGDSAEKPQVYLAITEDHLHSSVRAGENSGKSLDHMGVVRKLTSIGKMNQRGSDSPFDMQTAVKLDHDWKPENLRAVVFVQDSKSLHVLGAAEIPY
jgi:hypothetical protein